MQFFHFKEIPPASFPNNETQTLSHCPRANNNPSLALPSLDQTQLLQSARSSSSSQPDSACSGKLEGPPAGPAPLRCDGQQRQTVIGGLRDPYTSVCQLFVSKLGVQLLGFSESDLFSKGTGLP